MLHAALAAAAASLLSDASLRRRLASEARAVAERYYDWRRLGDQQEELLRAVVEGA